MNHLHILIPNLLSPLPLWYKDFGFNAQSTVLVSQLARSQLFTQAGKGLDRCLFTLLNYSQEQELPAAYYRYQLDFGHPPQQALMCADLVHLQAGVDEIILAAELLDDLSNDDRQELMARLNQYFAEDGWQFVAARSGHCYLLYQGGETIQTTPIDIVRGQSVFNYLPQSSTLNWHRLQNEIQMLLHGSSLNQSREIAGQQAVNSLWFWGAGTQQTVTHSIKRIWGGNSSAKIAALAGNIPHQALPSDNDYQNLAEGEHIVVLDQLYYPAITDNYTQWQTALDAMETQYLAPLLSWAKQHKKTVSVYDTNGQCFALNNRIQWKFWQRSSLALYDLATK